VNFLLLQTGSQGWVTQEEQEEEEKIWSWSEWGREGDKFVKADRNSSAKFLPCTHMSNLTTLWIWFCRSFLWCEVLARGNLQEYCCVFSLRSRHGCKFLYFIILRTHGNARAHHTCVTRPLRSLFGWVQDLIFFTFLRHLANFCCSPRLFRDPQVCNFFHTRAKKIEAISYWSSPFRGRIWACFRRVGLKQRFWVFRTVIISTACYRFWSLPQGSSLFWNRRSSSNHTSSILRCVYVLNVFTS
jgi:hypothetical protein